MLNQFKELFNTQESPIEKLVELNISTANTVAHQQSLLIASLVDNSITFSQSMSATPDLINFMDAQSKFNADVQNQLSESIKTASETLNKAQKDVESILNDSLSAFKVETEKKSAESQPIVPKELIKSKAAPKAEVKAAPKAKVKAAPKAKVKVAPKAEVKVAPKAEVKAAPKAEVKAAPKAEVKVAPKAEVKVAPKAAVKAAPKAKVKTKSTTSKASQKAK